MTTFNVNNSKIDQLNDTGNNYQLSSTSGKIALSIHGSAVQVDGENNRVAVDHQKTDCLTKGWNVLKQAGKWLFGRIWN